MNPDTLLVILLWTLPIVGVAVATCGGMLALLADPDRPAQCVPVFALAGAVFLGGIALVCWYQTVAEQLQSSFVG